MCLENLEYLRDLIAREQQTRTLKAIAAEASVGESWLRMFMRGKIPDPGYSKVTRLLSILGKCH